MQSIFLGIFYFFSRKLFVCCCVLSPMDVLFCVLSVFSTTRLVFWILTVPPSSVDLANSWTLIPPPKLTDLLMQNLDLLCLRLDSKTMSEKKCCVDCCVNSRVIGNDILHLFPNPKKDVERFNVWLNAIGGHILSMDPERVFANRRVCHLHFEIKYHTWSKRLSANAIPTLLLQKSHETAVAEITLRQSQQIDDQTLHVPNESQSEGFLALGNNEPSSKQQGSSPAKGPKQYKAYEQEIVYLGKKIKRLQKSKIDISAKLKVASKLTENAGFKKSLQYFTSPASTFTMMQFREVKKKKAGRRFTKDEKILALAMYKQGPRAYRWFRKFFVMPAPSTISRMLRNASLKPGLNENLFQQLKIRVDKMKDNEKLCILLFDEMALSPHFDYNKRNDKISGFVDNGSETKPQIAEHVLVFMLRGLHKNYKQPLAYTFCHKTTPAVALVQQIKLIVTKLIEIGLTVVSTVCDQGPTNVSAIKYLINETKKKYIRNNEELRNSIFEIDGHEVIPLFDPPHLIKGIRNNLLNKDLKCVIDGTEKTAKWEHVTKLYTEDPSYQGIRLMPKLTERHVVPAKISKMKVKCATQVFSQTVAANMGYLASHKIIPEESKETADVLLFFDQLFDSMNGSYKKSKKKTGKPLLGAVTPKSPHSKIWKEAKLILMSMKFIKNGKSSIVPSIKNWIMTIENIELIIKRLSDKNGLTSVWMRHFNQDPLENFFGCIRSHGYRNNSPTCAGFESAFAALLINNLSNVHSPGRNCEKDDCAVFKSLRKLFFLKSETSSGSIEIDFDDLNINFVDFYEKCRNHKIKAQIEYVTGYVLRNLKRKIFRQCKCCKDDLFGAENCFKYREYFKNTDSLTYPHINLIKCFSMIQDVVNHILRKKIILSSIKNYIKTILSVVIDYSFINCMKHKNEIVNQLQESSINLFIYTWCKNTNKLLTGVRSDYDDCDQIQKLAYDYINKMKKKT